MTQNERFVFDTNVLVSALLFANSKPAQAFFLALQRGIVLASLTTLQELNDVLHRKKLDRYLSVDLLVLHPFRGIPILTPDAFLLQMA